MEMRIEAAPSGGRVGPEGGGAGRMLTALVTAAFDVEEARLLDEGRGDAGTALARQVAMYLARTTLGFSFTAAGALFGRDRTTAAHACRVVETKREGQGFDQVVDCLERAIALWSRLGRQ